MEITYSQSFHLNFEAIKALIESHFDAMRWDTASRPDWKRFSANTLRSAGAAQRRIGISKDCRITCALIAMPAYAPASAFTCRARAAPMPCEVVPNAKPRAA